MECPKCDGRLLPGKIAYVSVETCGRCSGVWLDAEDILPAFEGFAKGSTVVAPKPLGSTVFGPPGMNYDILMGPCPICRPPRTMGFAHLDIGVTVRIDYCVQQHGVWLDSIEVYEFSRRLQAGAPAGDFYSRLVKAAKLS